MKKRLAMLLGGLLALALGTLVLLRVGLGWLVATDSFHDDFRQAGERAIRAVLPTVALDCGPVSLQGLMTLAAANVVVRNEKSSDAAFTWRQLTVTPQWRSLFAAGPLAVEIKLKNAGQEQGLLLAQIPRRFLLPDVHSLDEDLVITGELTSLDAAMVDGLLFPDRSGPRFQLTQGTVSMQGVVAKHLGGHGPTVAPRGHLTGHLSSTVWRLPSTSEPFVNIPAIDFAFALTAGQVTLERPVLVKEHTGESTVSGSLELPRSPQDEEAWNLRFAVAGDRTLARTLARLFRCKLPNNLLPVGSSGEAHFAITGPISHPVCGA